VIITWNDPNPNGSPLTGYKLYFNTHGSTTNFVEESVNCLGQSSAVLENRYCEVPFSTLTAAPYSLVLDEEIWVRVTANNFYGDSDPSEATNSGLVQLIPDAPVSLLNDPSVTDATQIKLTWSDGASNGGSVVLDYNVYYD